jgi:hypothetical protein
VLASASAIEKSNVNNLEKNFKIRLFYMASRKIQANCSVDLYIKIPLSERVHTIRAELIGCRTSTSSLRNISIISKASRNSTATA